MNTKQIIIVLAAFILGGVLGFLINGQICICKNQAAIMQQMSCSRMGFDGRDGHHRFDGRDGHHRFDGHEGRHFDKKHNDRHNPTEMLDKALSELDLTADQKSKIDEILKDMKSNKPSKAEKCDSSDKHFGAKCPKDGGRCMFGATIEKINSVLTEEQQKQLCDKMSAMRPHRPQMPPMPNDRNHGMHKEMKDVK